MDLQLNWAETCVNLSEESINSPLTSFPENWEIIMKSHILKNDKEEWREGEKCVKLHTGSC